MSFNEIAVNLLNASAGEDDLKILFSAIERRFCKYYECLRDGSEGWKRTNGGEITKEILAVASFHLILKVTIKQVL